MKNKLSNPFVTGGYIGPAYFCDREKEADLLMKAIESKRNVTLISLRRMGKTGLLKHVKHLLEQKKKSPVVIYADLLPTMNGNDMLNTLSSALLREKQYEKNIFEKLLTLLASLRPKMSYDELTGQPSIELKVETPAKQDLVFMMDEFQQITRYPEKNMESMLRTVIQTYPGVPFIFSGSSKHMLEPMFNAAERPFYQSAELMYLEKIAAEDYRNFIMDKFGAAHKKISPEVILKIFRFTRLHTFYVQHICNLLFESDQQEIDNTLINEIFQRVMTSNEPLFANYRNLLPSHQSGAFIHQYRLTSASSVTTSLKALADKEMIVQSDNRWQVYDVFFSRWLEYHYGGR
jgi:AAA+ ATPase superfamily predicted ATPase